MTKAKADYRGVQLANDTWISDIEYADVVILAENLETLIFILDRVNYFSTHIGLEINPSNSKVLFTCSSVGLAPVLSSLIREDVPAIKYLDCYLLPSDQAEYEVNARIVSARLAFLQLKSALWQRRAISLKLLYALLWFTVRNLASSS